MLIFLLIIIFILLVILAIGGHFAFRWAKIIFILEDDFTEALKVHERSLETFDNVLSMQMFFDSPKVRETVIEALEDIKMCRIATQKLVQKFTERSKQKYITEIEEE